MPRLSRLSSSYSRKLRSLRHLCRARLRLEELECRTVPSVFTPSQIRQAYGFDQIMFSANGQSVAGSGAGQTIAIVDAYDAPNIVSDLRTFDQKFGIGDLSSANSSLPYFRKVSPNGTLPAANAGWSQEASLDVEWAHAIAPQASILLVEAASSGLSDLLGAVAFAAAQPGVVAVSMSWGSSEFSGQNLYDSVFTTPSNHNGVTFVASSGDSGARSGVDWPASSPNVLSVGGSTLKLTSTGAYGSETAWGGSGGGYSQVESEPSYQQGVQNSGARTAPDVSFVANPNTGVYVYDSYPAGQGGWFQVGGTSVGAPQIAAMVAIADQGRALAGKGSLDGHTQTLPYIYALASGSYSTYFHDVTRGVNGYGARTGYDLVTGLGTPKANALVTGLVNSGSAAVTVSVGTAPSSSSTPVSTTTGPSAGSSNPSPGKPPSGAPGQQTPSGPSGSTGHATPLLILVTVNPPIAAAVGVVAPQVQSATASPTLPVTDPRVIPLATPAPRLTDSQVNGGSGNNPLNVGSQPQQDDDSDDAVDVTVSRDATANAPRMAPARVPQIAVAQSPAAWRQVSDFCFAEDHWRGGKSDEADVPATGDDSALDPSAAFVGLGVVLGSYWGAPPKTAEERKRTRFQY